MIARHRRSSRCLALTIYRGAAPRAAVLPSAPPLESKRAPSAFTAFAAFGAVWTLACAWLGSTC